MDNEKTIQHEKKRQEKEYYSKMIAENTKNQEMAKQYKEKMRLEDVAAQKAYARKLDQEEQDRKNEVAAREKRAQDFMNRMADGVLKDMDEQQRKEDEMIARYEREREVKMRKAEDVKAMKKAVEQKQITDTLTKQQVDKKRREMDEKSDINQQANMWQKERDIW